MSTVSDSLKEFGKSFLVAFYVPAMIFVLVHVYILGPFWLNDRLPAAKVLTISSLSVSVDLTVLAELVILPLALAVLLAGLNDMIIILLEGRARWLKHGLLYPLTLRNRNRHKKLYGKLATLRGVRSETQKQLSEAMSVKIRDELNNQIHDLNLQIDGLHQVLEKREPRKRYPVNVNHVTPTDFGNAFAVAEEYSFERYGMDAVLFWPKLRQIIAEKSPNLSAQLVRQKTSLDLNVNMCMVLNVLFLELSSTLVQIAPPINTFLAGLVISSLILAYLFFRASVNAVEVLGDLIATSFDFYRGALLETFNLVPPPDIDSEQVVWVRLAAFIRRGEPFYYPQSASRNGDRANKNKAPALGGVRIEFYGRSKEDAKK